MAGPTASNFWPELRRQMTSGEIDIADCPVRCSICLDPMNLGQDVEHQAVTLPCGHLLGAECLQFWNEQQEWNGQPQDCPCCKGPMEHTCGHRIKPIAPPIPTFAEDTESPGRDYGDLKASSIDQLKAVGKEFRSIRRREAASLAAQARREELAKFPKLRGQGGVTGGPCLDCFVHLCLHAFSIVIRPYIEERNRGLYPGEWVGMSAYCGGKSWSYRPKGWYRSGIPRYPLRDPHPLMEEQLRYGEIFFNAIARNIWIGADMIGIKLEMTIFV